VFELLRREGIHGVVSFSDPVPRRTHANELVLRGHYGSIYQSHNGIYVGRGAPSTLRLLADARAFSPRAAAKVRKLERGWRYAVELLIRHGAQPFDARELSDDRERRCAWLDKALQTTTRSFRHAGNHKYVWGLDRCVHRAVAHAVAQRSPGGHLRPYPKQVDSEVRVESRRRASRDPAHVGVLA
jgi:hypothetical protein